MPNCWILKVIFLKTSFSPDTPIWTNTAEYVAMNYIKYLKNIHAYMYLFPTKKEKKIQIFFYFLPYFYIFLRAFIIYSYLFIISLLW